MVGENISLGCLGPVVGLAVREGSSGTRSRDYLSASVAHVPASLHANDTRTLAGPCIGRQRRKAVGVVFPWLDAMLYAMSQTT